MSQKFLYAVGDYAKILNYFSSRDKAEKFYRDMIKRAEKGEFGEAELIVIACFRFDKIIKLWKRKKKR